MKSFNQFVKNRSENSTVNENDMNPHITVPGNGLMNQLRHAQEQMDMLFNKMNGEKIPKILEDLMYKTADQSRIIADIIKSMPEEAVMAFYQQRNAQGHNQM